MAGEKHRLKTPSLLHEQVRRLFRVASGSATALQRWELENDVVDMDNGEADSIFYYDEQQQVAIQNQKPWTNERPPLLPTVRAKPNVLFPVLGTSSRAWTNNNQLCC